MLYILYAYIIYIICMLYLYIYIHFFLFLLDIVPQILQKSFSLTVCVQSYLIYTRSSFLLSVSHLICIKSLFIDVNKPVYIKSHLIMFFMFAFILYEIIVIINILK